VSELDYETKVSFRGRTLGGRANWSLNGNNCIVINANAVWNADLDELYEYVAKRRPEVDYRWFVLTVQSLFVKEFARIAAHETLHLVLHQEPEVRRFLKDRFREQDTHHGLMERMEAF